MCSLSTLSFEKRQILFGWNVVSYGWFRLQKCVGHLFIAVTPVYSVKVEIGEPYTSPCHFASRPVGLVRLSIHLKAWWSVCIVKGFPLHYEHKRSIDHTTTRHSRSAIKWLCSICARDQNQYSIGFVILFGCGWGKTQSTWTLGASASDFKWPLEWKNASTSVVIIVCLRVSLAFISLLWNSTRVSSWFFFRYWFSSITNRAKFGALRRMTLDISQKDLHLVRLAGTLSLFILSVGFVQVPVF